MNSTTEKYFSQVKEGFLFIDENRDMFLIISALSLNDKEKLVIGRAKVITPVSGILKDGATFSFDMIEKIVKLQGLYSISCFPGTIFQMTNPEFFVDGE